MTIHSPHIDLNIGSEQRAAMHGRHVKDQIIVHETVSPNEPGLSDLRGISSFLGTTRHDGVLYGIHGITDAEGHKAWASGYGDAVFYHCASSGLKGSGSANERGIGIEQISPVAGTTEDRIKWWDTHKTLLNATAELVAWQAALRRIPLVHSLGNTSGVTTHWDVSHFYAVPGGHVDCWPRQNGGWYPIFDLISLAKKYALEHYNYKG